MQASLQVRTIYFNNDATQWNDDYLNRLYKNLHNTYLWRLFDEVFFFRAPSYDSPGHHGEECVKVCFGNFLFQMFFDHALSKAITKIKTRRFPRRNVTMWRNKSARKCPKSSVLQRRWSLVIIIIIIIIFTILHHKNSNSIMTAPPRTTWA